MFDIILPHDYHNNNNYYYYQFQKSQDRPALPQVQAPSDASPGAQDTMAMNIMKILAERREKLSKYFEILNFQFHHFVLNF